MLERAANPELRRQQGFTLIELLIVVAIIGILAAIAIPQYAQYRAQAFNSAAESDLRNALTALEAHYASEMAYPNPNNDLIDELEDYGIDEWSDDVEVQYDVGSGNQTFEICTGQELGDRAYYSNSTTANIYHDDGDEYGDDPSECEASADDYEDTL